MRSGRHLIEDLSFDQGVTDKSAEAIWELFEEKTSLTQRVAVLEKERDACRTAAEGAIRAEFLYRGHVLAEGEEKKIVQRIVEKYLKEQL